jgi:hypothetical protein
MSTPTWALPGMDSYHPSPGTSRAGSNDDDDDDDDGTSLAIERKTTLRASPMGSLAERDGVALAVTLRWVLWLDLSSS